MVLIVEPGGVLGSGVITLGNPKSNFTVVDIHRFLQRQLGLLDNSKRRVKPKYGNYSNLQFGFYIRDVVYKHYRKLKQYA